MSTPGVVTEDAVLAALAGEPVEHSSQSIESGWSAAKTISAVGAGSRLYDNSLKVFQYAFKDRVHVIDLDDDEITWLHDRKGAID
ncbi:MAG: hypothetical protein OEY28_12385, partial [Nitrospira sp.]|nr:hypothetical protein [Nitrospira sp.]